jgi:hypothetical protein
MHITIMVPNPLASLARILVALERGSGGADPRLFDQCGALDRREGALADDHHDLESLSLSRCGPIREQRCDDLDFLSLSMVERTHPDRRDSLVNLSLTRSFPPRSGP